MEKNALLPRIWWSPPSLGKIGRSLRGDYITGENRHWSLSINGTGNNE
jgi:hypothetical protein